MRTIAILLALGSAAFAADVKRIDFTMPIVDDGVPVIDDVLCPLKKVADPQTGILTNSRDCDTPLTLGEVVYRALRFPDREITWDEGIKRDEIGLAVRRAKDWPLTDDQRKMIEKAVPKVYPTPALFGIMARMMK
jgi:hypothetical protein